MTAGDLSLASAVKRHVRFVYKEANQKILGISRATLSRHLRGLDHKWSGRIRNNTDWPIF